MTGRSAICYHPFFGSVWGGAEAVALHIMGVLADAGLETLILSEHPLSPSELARGAALLSVGDLRPHRLRYGRVRRIRFFPAVLWRYDAFLNTLLQLRDVKCDLYVNTKANLLPLVPVPSSVLEGTTPAIMYVHWPTIGEAWMRKPIYLPLVAAVRRLVGTIRRRGDIRLLASSKYTAARTERVLSLRPEVVYPPVNVDAIPFSTSRQREPSAVTVARFSREKNLEVALLMATRVKGLRRLYICGMLQDRSYYADIRRIIRELGLEHRVRLFPNAERATIMELLGRCGVYVHTCVGEPFGISVVEAMAAGCIPVVPSVGGPSEYVPRDLQYSSEEEFAAIVGREIERPSYDRAEMRAIALRFSVQRFRARVKTLVNDLV